MKRDQLKKLGLSDEQIKSVMDLNGDDINKAKSGNAEVLEENQALKDQIKERDKDLKTLRTKAKDNEDLSTQLKEWQDKYKKDTADLTTKLSQTKLNNAVDNALNKAHVRNIKSIKGLLDMNSIKLDENGELSGLDDQINNIKQSDSYLFDEGKKQDYQPTSGKPAKTDEVQQMVDVFKGDFK